MIGSTVHPLLSYFRSQRCAAPWDERDRRIPFVGPREGTVDVHGGWYDASGDVSKYLSHLSYANFMNPQQTPLVVWALLEHLERRSVHEAGVRDRVLDEVRHGADFLCRMQDPRGYFYMTVFDQWSKVLERRVVCAYRTQAGELLEDYQAGFRQGGGLAIAALARAGRVLSEARYLRVAKEGYAHLAAHNASYLDDGKENIIDDYCALLALTELFAAGGEEDYLAQARARAQNLMSRLRSDGPHPGWLRADDGSRPFFHAADAGLPACALLRLAEVDTSRSRPYLEAVETMMNFELWVTAEVDNPFDVARQYVQDVHGQKRTSFFIPHENETGYWWQGENARLASLAAAAGWLAQHTGDQHLRDELRRYATNQLDWILGKNPFDSCMLHGFGRNNQNYMTEWPNVLGGICNGITSGLDDERDVDFGRDDVAGDHGWRWYEQWLPHAAWYLIALAELDP